MNNFELGLEDSFEMDFDMDLFLTVKRSRSEDSLFGRLQPKESENEKKFLVFKIEDACNMKNESKQTQKCFKSQKRISKKSKPDYNKNICGYITKKIIREFISPTFEETVQTLCLKHGCSYKEAKKYYFKKIERVTGPSHIPELLRPECESERSMKKAFSEFFEWFLKERYVRYLMVEGKMAKKSAYIRYKNRVLMQIFQANTLDSQDRNSERVTG